MACHPGKNAQKVSAEKFWVEFSQENLQHLYCAALLLIRHIYVALRGGQLFVASQLHDHFGRNPRMGEPRDEPAPPAV